MDAITSRSTRSRPARAQGRDRGLGSLLRDGVVLLRRNIWLIAAFVTVAVAAAAVLTILATPRYTAQSTVEIGSQAATVLGGEVEDEMRAAVGRDPNAFLNTQLEFLRSRALAARVVRRLNLTANRRFFSAMEASPLVKAREQVRFDAAVSLVRLGFNADLRRTTRIAVLSFTSTDPALSADLANAYAAEFIQANLQRNYDSSSYARNFVAEQLKEARARLEASERQLNAYARQARLIHTRDPNDEEESSARSVTASSLLQLNQAANKAQANRIQAQSRWSAERAQPLFASQTALSSPTVQSLMDRRADLQGRLEAAKERYLGDHPTVRTLEAELAAVETELNRAASEARNSVRAGYDAAVAVEQGLRSQVGSLQGATLAEQDRSVRYNTLAREADTNRSLYDSLLMRDGELNAMAGITLSNIAIVDTAEVPRRPSSPDLLRNMIAGLLIGLASAVILVFLRDQLDDRLRNPEDVEDKTGMRLLGVIVRSDHLDPADELLDPKSVLAEGYNALRTSLTYSMRDGPTGILLVTSAKASEGKTTTSYAVARCFAQTGKRVLLMDADLRRPSVHKLIQVRNAKGLASILTNQAAVPDCIATSGLDGMHVLPAGPVPPSPAELLSSPRMAALLEQSRHSYDLVVIDSAPVLGLADPIELAALADEVVLVIDASRGRGGDLKNAIRRLRSSAPMILGAVLTKFDPKHASNPYSSYYGYEDYRYSNEQSTAG